MANWPDSVAQEVHVFSADQRQYYESVVIDRPLSAAAQKKLRAMTSRAMITSTQLVNTYEWGDFKGDPHALVAKYFDALLYYANWGTRWLILRLPTARLDTKVVRWYCPILTSRSRRNSGVATVTIADAGATGIGRVARRARTRTTRAIELLAAVRWQDAPAGPPALEADFLCSCVFVETPIRRQLDGESTRIDSRHMRLKPGFHREAADIHAAEAAADAEYYRLVRQLFREHNRALVNFLLTRVRSEQEALDVAQEAYVRLLQLHRRDTVSFLQGYLFRIAANLSIDRARRRSVADKAAVSLFDDLEYIEPLDVQAITTQECDVVATALNELSARHRLAFVRHVVEGYSTPEVARELGVDERTVRKLVSRALLHCRERLGMGEAKKGE